MQASGIILLFVRLGVIGGIVSLGAQLSSLHLVFDLISHFRVQYIVLIFPALCLALCWKRYVIAVILIICISVHVFVVYESQENKELVQVEKALNLSVMSSNLLASNSDYDIHVDFINSVNPDVIVFQEYTSDWDKILSVSLDSYPHKLSVVENTPFGIAIYSKKPFIDKKVVFLYNGSSPSVDVTISNGERKLRVFGTHPPPPINTELYQRRNLHLGKIAELAKTQSSAFVVVGDLNTSPWSNNFRDFLDNGKLFDGRRGHGLMPTWPSWFIPLQIPIDYIVVNKSVNVESMDTSSGLGSDHRTLWARLSY